MFYSLIKQEKQKQKQMQLFVNELITQKKLHISVKLLSSPLKTETRTCVRRGGYEPDELIV